MKESSYSDIENFIKITLNEHIDNNNIIKKDEIDSFLFVEFVLTLENEYNIEFDTEMLSMDILKSMPSLIKYILKKIQEGVD